MGSSDLAIRFTEEKYSSKSDVMKELKTSLIDNIWANIIEYRKGLFRPLGIHAIDNREFNICNCQSLISRNTNIDMKLLRVMKQFNSFSNNEKNSLELTCYINCIKPLARSHKLDDQDSSLRMIVRNEIKTNDPDTLLLSRYIKALNFIKNRYVNGIDVSTILNLYKILVNDESASFRNKDNDDPNNRVLIDRVYTSAPARLVEPLINQLVSFINHSAFDSIITASVAYFYINMIKPFDKYNEEVSLLVVKYIIANDSMGEDGVFVPFENIIDANNEVIAKLFNDTQKYYDLTYFALFAIDFADSVCDSVLELLSKNKLEILQNEFYQGDEEVKLAPVIEEAKKEVVIEKIIVHEENKPAPTPVVINEEKLAVNYIPNELSDRDAARLANHLLELDPSLKKNEANFYSKHCVLGKKYTIQQFKKSIGCAYETARTSMDHLAELGYYRKEAVKNKFVYSPIAR